MEINIIKNPTGTFSVVGFRVPGDLVYRQLDGSNLTAEQARKIHVGGIGLAGSYAKSVTWASLTAATDDILARYPDAVIKAPTLVQPGAIPVREGDLTGLGDRALKDGSAIRPLAARDRLVEEVEFRDDDLWCNSILDHRRREEGGDTIDPAEEQLP